MQAVPSRFFSITITSRNLNGFFWQDIAGGVILRLPAQKIRSKPSENAAGDCAGQAKWISYYRPVTVARLVIVLMSVFERLATTVGGLFFEAAISQMTTDRRIGSVFLI